MFWAWPYLILFFLFFSFSFSLHHLACGILIPRPRVKLTPPALKVKSLNHWTVREVPLLPNILVWKGSQMPREPLMGKFKEDWWEDHERGPPVSLGLNCGFSNLPPWPLFGFAERQWWFQSHQSQLYAKQFIGSKGLIPSTKRSGLCPWILGSDL